MKTENYTKKDGSAAVRYRLEKGDVVKSLFAKPKESVFANCKYPLYSLKALWNEKQIFVTLTAGQYKRLMGLGNLEDKSIKAVSYQGPEGKELVGLELKE
jgi:hypothetical protein